VLSFVRSSPTTKSETRGRTIEADIREALFGVNPRAFCDIAEWEASRSASVWFYTYSTFSGRHGIWLELMSGRVSAARDRQGADRAAGEALRR
jgi:hypothetical protein